MKNNMANRLYSDEELRFHRIMDDGWFSLRTLLAWIGIIAIVLVGMGKVKPVVINTASQIGCQSTQSNHSCYPPNPPYIFDQNEVLSNQVYDGLQTKITPNKYVQ